MLLETERVIERVGGMTTEKHMGMKPSSKAFRTMSTILYKDRIKAIVRELSCNAYDSHVEAGCPEIPFEIHLPNGFDPYFSVRDFGVGISPDDMETVYCTYFESTKENKPDQTGTLGLGSKSPLCYTNSFTVTSFIDGTRNHYVIFFDEEDLPTIKLLISEPTNEPRGLEVKIPLANNSDRTTFAEKAKDIFAHFETMPKFIGEDIDIEKPEIVLHGKNWRYVTNRNRSNPIAIMAHVAYPIDEDSIPNLSYQEKQILNHNEFEIEFPNNYLTFMAGRDDLSYDKKTCKVIKDALKKIYDDIEPAISRVLEHCANDYEARLSAMDIDSIGLSRTGVQHLYKGKPIDLFYNLNESEIGKVKKVWSVRGKRRKIEWGHMLHLGKHVAYVIDDSPKGVSNAKIHNFMKTHWHEVLYIFNTSHLRDEADIRKALPHIPFQNYKDIGLDAAVPRKKGFYAGRQANQTMVLNHYEAFMGNDIYAWKKSLWDSATLPGDEGGIYINRKYSDMEGAWVTGVHSTLSFLKECYEIGVISHEDEIYGLSPTNKKHLTGEWYELYELIEWRTAELLACYGGDITTLPRYEVATLRMAYSEFSDEYVQYMLSNLTEVPNEHPLKRFFAYLNQSDERNDNLINFLVKMKLITPTESTVVDEWTTLTTKYPLLPKGNRRMVPSKHIKNYIDMCDGTVDLPCSKPVKTTKSKHRK